MAQQGQYSASDVQPQQGKYSAADVAPAETPSALSRLGSAFWEGIGGKALTDIALGGTSLDPEVRKRGLDTVKSLVNGIKGEPGRMWDELSQSGQSMLSGHPVDAVSHIAKAVPVVGGGAANVQHDFENGDYATGFGHAMALLLPFAVKSGAVSSLAESAPDIATAAKGAVKGAAKGATDWKTYVGAWPAGKAAEMVGLPAGAGEGAVIGGRILAGAVKGAKSELASKLAAATKAMEQAAPPPPATPGQILAESQGMDWASLKPDAQASLESVAHAQASTAEQMAAARARAASRPAPVQAPAPTAQAPPVPQSIQEMIQAEIAARSPQATGRAPLRPPLAPTAPPPPESATVPPASTPRVPLSPPVGPAPPQSPAGAVAPPPARTLAQAEAAMAQKAPAPLEPPTSQYTSTGERKSPELRAAEITGSNVAAKAQRFVQALHDAGVTSSDARSIPVGRLSVKQIEEGGVPGWGNVTDDLVSKGVLKAGENPPSQSIPEIVKGLKRLEAQKIAAELADEMKRSGTIK